MANSLKQWQWDTYFINSFFIQSRQQFLTLCLKVFKLFVSLINSGKLFHRKGPTNEIAFFYFLCLFCNKEQIQKFVSDNKYKFYWEIWR